VTPPVTSEPGFTIETAGGAEPPDRTLRRGFVTILILAALILRPYADPRRGDFALYLQARSFAQLRLDIPLPPDVAIPAEVVMRDGRFYAAAPPGASLLLVPFVWVGWLLDESTGGRLGRQAAGGFNVSNAEYAAVHVANLFVLAGILFFLSRLGRVLLAARSPGIVTRAAELLFFTAPLWHESSHPVSVLPATMFMLGTTSLVFQARSERAPWVQAGALAAAAILVRPTDLVLAMLLLAYALGVARRPIVAVLRFAAPLAAGLVVLFGVNAATRGASLGTSGSRETVDSAVRMHFGTPLAVGLVGLTVGAISGRGPGDGKQGTMVLPDASMPWKRVRGLLLVMPVVLLGIAGLLRLERADQRAEAAVIGGSFLLLLLLFAQSSRWSGDSATPLASRFLTEAMPAWCLVTAAWADEAKGFWRSLFLIAACWSAGNQLLVVLSPYVAALSGVDITAAHVWKIASLLLIASLFAWLAEGTRRGYVEDVASPRLP
jgi:hypothetical protein